MIESTSSVFATATVASPPPMPALLTRISGVPIRDPRLRTRERHRRHRARPIVVWSGADRRLKLHCVSFRLLHRFLHRIIVVFGIDISKLLRMSSLNQGDHPTTLRFLRLLYFNPSSLALCRTSLIVPDRHKCSAASSIVSPTLRAAMRPLTSISVQHLPSLAPFIAPA